MSFVFQLELDIACACCLIVFVFFLFFFLFFFLSRIHMYRGCTDITTESHVVFCARELPSAHADFWYRAHISCRSRKRHLLECHGSCHRSVCLPYLCESIRVAQSDVMIISCILWAASSFLNLLYTSILGPHSVAAPCVPFLGSYLTALERTKVLAHAFIELWCITLNHQLQKKHACD